MQHLNKIPLLNFEAYAENEHLLLAEKLFEENKLLQLTEIKKGLWEGIISAEQDFSTKIGIFKDHVIQAGCSCSASEKDITFCAHTICTLFGIRQKLVQEFAPKIIDHQRKKSINIRSILEIAGLEDLKHFLLAFSKKDKKFRILLMTYFARQFHDQSEGNIYQQILEDCYPVSEVLQSKNTRQNAQLLILVANELLLQAKDALSLAKYTEAFQILRELITKLAYATYTNTNSREVLDELQISAHGYYHQLLALPLAPAFLQQIIDTMLDFVQVSFYHFTGTNNFYNTLSKTHLDEHRMDTFARSIQQKINSIRQLETRALLYSIWIKIQYSMREPFTQTIDKLKDPALLNEVIIQLNKPENKELLEDFLEKLKNSKLISLTMQYKHLLALYASIRNPEKQLFYATELFRLTRELQYYRMIKNINFEGKTLSYPEFIQKKLNLSLDRDLRLALELCVLENDFDLLIRLLNQKASLEWFMEYDRFLVKEKKVDIYSFYRDYLVNYHKDHLGLKAVHRANTVISHLEKLDMIRESEKLKKELISIYPKRTSLKEHLE
ncbi:MAG TPA: hypothetical protein DCX89_04975 [Saprospirales bacterium]|nr:hypothetical protein [Saprospirales bacterium]HRQ30919.1 hypothetical protein [Saprospiraceae bacterium]